VPASQAAIDDAGMQYTSAAEGFYGSLRVGFQSVNQDNADTTSIDQLSSRLGVRGTADLGGGLTASYRYEFSVNGDNGATKRERADGESVDDTGIGNTRLQNVGLSGGFGSLLIGTQWALDYNYVWGTTDVMNLFGGNHAYNANRAGRQSNAITYTSPDLNGFSFGGSAVVDNEPDAGGGDDKSDADSVDKVVFAAGYSRAGLDVAGTYVRRAITATDTDTSTAVEVNPTTLGLAFGYGQDNWSIDYWYGQTDYGAGQPEFEDKLHSLAGQLGVGKATLRAIWERRTVEEGPYDADVDFVTLGVQYGLGSRARIFAEYDTRDADDDFYDSSPILDPDLTPLADRDRFLLGYRVDF